MVVQNAGDLTNDVLHDEKYLLSLVARGDGAAFSRLFAFYRDRVYSVAYRFTHSHYVSEEIVQDVFMKIWSKRKELPEISNFAAYLFIVTRNDVFRVLKKMARESRVLRLDEAPQMQLHNEPSDRLAEREFDSLLHAAVEQLPQQQKTVYKYVREQGMKREEVAQLLRLHPETVKFHLSQAMKKIRSFCIPRLHLFAALTILAWLFVGKK